MKLTEAMLRRLLMSGQILDQSIIANNRAEELSIKRLTKNNPTMAVKFAEFDNTDKL